MAGARFEMWSSAFGVNWEVVVMYLFSSIHGMYFES